jgi:hypothetical protein
MPVGSRVPASGLVRRSLLARRLRPMLLGTALSRSTPIGVLRLTLAWDGAWSPIWLLIFFFESPTLPYLQVDLLR